MQKLRYKLKFGWWIEFAQQLDKIKIMALLCNIFDSAWSEPWTWFLW